MSNMSFLGQTLANIVEITFQWIIEQLPHELHESLYNKTWGRIITNADHPGQYAQDDRLACPRMSL